MVFSYYLYSNLELNSLPPDLIFCPVSVENKNCEYSPFASDFSNTLTKLKVFFSNFDAKRFALQKAKILASNHPLQSEPPQTP